MSNISKAINAIINNNITDEQLEEIASLGDYSLSLLANAIETAKNLQFIRGNKFAYIRSSEYHPSAEG